MYPHKQRAKIDDAVLKMIKTCHKKAIEILEGNKDKLHELTKYLVEKETITGEEFIGILNDRSKSEEE